MLNKDQIKGKARRIMGAIKENLGWLTDDHKAEGEGKTARTVGKAQEYTAGLIRKQVTEDRMAQKRCRSV